MKQLESKHWTEKAVEELRDKAKGEFMCGLLTEEQLSDSLASPCSGEYDPNGVEQHAPGAKLDAGKVRPGLVLGDFSNALLAVSEVGTFGANKYTDHGWLSVEDGVNRYKDAMMRHMLKHNTGELIDEETGLTHLAAVAWNVLAMIELTTRDSEK